MFIKIFIDGKYDRFLDKISSKVELKCLIIEILVLERKNEKAFEKESLRVLTLRG